MLPAVGGGGSTQERLAGEVRKGLNPLHRLALKRGSVELRVTDEDVDVFMRCAYLPVYTIMVVACVLQLPALPEQAALLKDACAS